MKLLSFIRMIFLLLLIVLAGGGCRKAFLAQKPSTNLLIPNSLTVLQELLDNEPVMNVTPALGEVSADNYYLLYTAWVGLDIKEYNAYIWAPDLYQGQGLVSDWDFPYQQVFYANTVLQGLAGIQPDSTDQAQWNMLKGWALFCRAYAFFNIAELFAEPYDSSTAATDRGIPIRLSPDVNVKTTRATLQASYAQILNDLNIAEELLPSAIPVNNLNRPSRLAVQALLARIYLSVRDYMDAGKYADSVLRVYSYLLDYNTLTPDTGYSIIVQRNMPEILYQSNFPDQYNGNTLVGLICSGCIVDTNLIASYVPNDLRRSIYFQQDTLNYQQPYLDTFLLKGSYSGGVFPFSGLATDELFLIRAECNARQAQITSALNDLDSLLIHRLRTGTFTAFKPNMSAAETLDTILLERRKELAFRGIRWSDLRRLYKDGLTDTLYRNLNGQVYTLPPGSSLYTLPIPPDVINFSGIQQNPR
jgi:starch-binding outer membrane protein, SusD/RagB family